VGELTPTVGSGDRRRGDVAVAPGFGRRQSPGERATSALTQGVTCSPLHRCEDRYCSPSTPFGRRRVLPLELTMTEAQRPAPSLASARSRRSFLVKGGAAAAASAVAATALTATPAQAQQFQFIYLPLPPERVYDSRISGGRISTGQVRTLFTDPLENDLAYCFNLTVTQTASSGWMAVYPGDEPYSGTSTVNWFASSQTQSNNAYTAFANDGSIRFRCGGGGASTHFIVDLVAALIVVDFSVTLGAGVASLGARREQARTPWSTVPPTLE
jgi:hypothetical protein